MRYKHRRGQESVKISAAQYNFPIAQFNFPPVQKNIFLIENIISRVRVSDSQEKLVKYGRLYTADILCMQFSVEYKT